MVDKLTAMIRGIVTVSVGLIAIIVLGGCAPAADSPAAAPATASTPTPTLAPHTASPTPTPTAPPVLADLVLSPAGLGPLLVGSPVPAQVDATAVVKWNPTTCNGAGEWQANYPSGPVVGGNDAPFSWASMGKSDPIGYVLINSSGIRTATGVGVGSTVADLKAAYTNLGGPIHAEYSDLYTESDSSGQLIFEVATRFAADGEVVWSKNDLGTVLWVQVQPRSVKPRSLTAWQGGAHCFE